MLSKLWFGITSPLTDTSGVFVHDAESGELFDDIIRHGSHDIFWCYGFESDVAKYKRTSTNQKSNEISYTSYFLRQCFTITYNIIQKDLEGILPNSRGLLQIHKHLRLPSNLYKAPAENIVVCDYWHDDCVMVVHSQQLVRELSKVFYCIGICQCVEMIRRK